VWRLSRDMYILFSGMPGMVNPDLIKIILKIPGTASGIAELLSE
jgi:hypothetical protein